MTVSADIPTSGRRARHGPWYVTAVHIEERTDGGAFTARPLSMAHAKEMGTTTAACGVLTYSWRPILDLPFPIPPGAAPRVEMCRKCLTRVIGEWL